jgi:hypothetical protein
MSIQRNTITFGAIGLLTIGALILEGCQKESLPINDVGSEGSSSIGETKMVGGTTMFALTAQGGVSDLYSVTTAGVYTYLATIKGPGSTDVDHFKGITWDPVNNCTWLVTNNTATVSAHKNMLWQIPGPLPLIPVGILNATPVAALTITGGAAVLDAMDVEYDAATGTIFLLRNTPAGTFPKLATLSVIGGTAGRVTNLSGTPPNVQGFTISCNKKLIALKTVTVPPQLIELSRITGAPTGLSVAFSTPAFTAPDGGIEPMPACLSNDLFAANAFVGTLGFASRLGTPYLTNPTIRNTLDMTTM